MNERCPSSYHCRFSAEYDGRLRILRRFANGGWEEQCEVCGFKRWQFLAPDRVAEEKWQRKNAAYLAARNQRDREWDRQRLKYCD